MSRKKKSPADPGVTTQTKPVEPPQAAGNGDASAITAVKPQGVPRSHVPAPTRKPPEDRFWLEVIGVRLSRWLGSLQVAVLLLVWFATVLIVGTIVESWYDGKVAQQLVYKTWWFTTLLALLGVNIFCAASKKADLSLKGGWGGVWPWKKHQTGFLITHVGLLTMVAGGIWTSYSGTDALMVVVDSEDPNYAQYPTTTRQMIDSDTSIIQVKRPHQDKAEVLQFPFQPGPLCWRADEYLQPKVDWLPAVLGELAHPLPHSWQADVGDGAHLEVLAYYPHARQERFGPAKQDETASSFPAFKFQLASPMGGLMPEQWVAYHGSDRESGMGAGLVQVLARDCPAEMVEEFRHPPPPDKVGKKGQLVLMLAGQKYRFDVDQAVDHAPGPLGNSGWNLHSLHYLPNMEETGDDTPTNPTLVLDLQGPDGKSARIGTMARQEGEMLAKEDRAVLKNDLQDLRVWYHPPDYRWGSASLRGLLQIVTGTDGKIYYRSFNSHKGPFAFEKTGTVEKDQKWERIWEGMNFKFRITQFLPQAVPGPYFIPEDRRPGLEDEDLLPAIRCRMTAGSDSREFWTGKTDAGFTPVTVGQEIFLVGYHTYTHDLDFDIALERAEQTSDPGTGSAASYTSYVRLTDPKQNIQGQPRVITMNEPLDHGGYKLYQSGYKLLGADANLKPVSRSVFTVSHDPGLWMKYLGSSMLALGIVCMFYMKAYFFTPRGRSRPAADPLSNGTGTQEI